MYNLDYKNICLKIYNYLDRYSIKGNEKKDFIKNVCGISISSLYYWLIEDKINKKEDNNIINNIDFERYTNKKITVVIEQYIIYLFNRNIVNIKQIKKEINKKLLIRLSYRDILSVFKLNNLVSNEQKLKVNIDKCIINNINKNNLLTAKDLIEIIYNKFNITRSTTYIYNVLSLNGITYKKTKLNSNPHEIEKQKEQINHIYEKIKKVDINNIISIDEISISHFEQRRKGWSKKGEECIIDLKNIKGNKKHQRYSVLMATSNNKIINYTIVEKGIKSDTFNKFMNKLHIMDKKKKNIYFMDNATIHTNKKFNILKDKLNLNVIYNAPYHSEFNPIEYVFSLLRKNIERNINNSKENIINIINTFNRNISSLFLKNIFNHSFELMEKF
jgi:hypothetical protein